MAYVKPNFRTKKALREALKRGDRVEVFQPNNLFNITFDGTGSTAVEGPHFPEPHKWYASVTYKDGVVLTAK